MTDTEGKREQLSVPVKPELRRAIERAAQAEDRPVASWVRRLIERSLAAEARP
jgi:predicted HicB family RNase H-like nuclease